MLIFACHCYLLITFANSLNPDQAQHLKLFDTSKLFNAGTPELFFLN